MNADSVAFGQSRLLRNFRRSELELHRRDDKLWRRQLAACRSASVGKIKCPCTICNCRGNRVSVHTVKKHLLLYSRHPTQRHWWGDECDTSDDEWNEYLCEVDPIAESRNDISETIIGSAIDVN